MSSTNSCHNTGTRIKICVIGAGRMGQIRTRVIYSNPRLELVGIIDCLEIQGTSLAQKFNSKYYKSLTDAYNANTDIHAVCLSTPTFTHHSCIEEAAKLGIAIFTEKPVGETADAIATCFDICRMYNVPLCCGFQRRFDKSYTSLYHKVKHGAVGNPLLIHVFFADHPCPPIEFLKSGGDPFMDLAPHDIDFIRWILDEKDMPVEIYGCGSSSTDELKAAGVLDNATMTIRFEGGATCNIMMSRNGSYGYDQRCEVYGSAGIASVENVPETTVVHGDSAGMHRAVHQYSFPERFRGAFEVEIDCFADVVASWWCVKHESARVVAAVTWPVTERDCVMAQLIATAAKVSCARGQPVVFDPAVLAPTWLDTATASPNAKPVALRPIGNGVFARFIATLLAQDSFARTHFKNLSPFSRSSTLDWGKDVLNDASVDAVYVCSPDDMHCTQALGCLRAGKHVLVEKPVVNYKALSQYLTTCTHPPVCMVGFHRRFDAEYGRARNHVQELLRQLMDGTLSGTDIGPICIESYDPVPADPDLSFVLNNSICHDVDTIFWMFTSDLVSSVTTTSSSTTRESAPLTADVVFSQCTTDASCSGIKFGGLVTVTSTGSADIIASIPLQINYCKLYPSYVQRVTVNGQCFGYDYTPTADQSCFVIYNTAYCRQWECFGRNISQIDVISHGQYNGDKDDSSKFDIARDMGYCRTFTELEKLQLLLHDSITYN